MGSSMFWMNVTVVPEWRGVPERPLPQCQGWFVKLNGRAEHSPFPPPGLKRFAPRWSLHAQCPISVEREENPPASCPPLCTVSSLWKGRVAGGAGETQSGGAYSKTYAKKNGNEHVLPECQS